MYETTTDDFDAVKDSYKSNKMAVQAEWDENVEDDHE